MSEELLLLLVEVWALLMYRFSSFIWGGETAGALENICLLLQVSSYKALSEHYAALTSPPRRLSVLHKPEVGSLLPPGGT